MVQLPEGERRLRVVYLGHVARLSGGEIALLRLLPAVVERVDAHVILGEDGPLVGALRAAGVSVEVLPMREGLREARKDTVRPVGVDPRTGLALLGYVLRLRRRLLELQPDLVHTNSLKAALYGGVAGRLARLPVVWHIRDRIADDYLPRPAVRLVHAASRVLPTAIIANSEATLATLPAGRRRSVLYNPVVPGGTAEQPVERRPRSGPLRIGVVGRLASWKGQHVFLRAFSQAFRAGEAEARIIGSALFGEQAYEAELRALADELGIADRILWRGFREDVAAELRELDVLVHCSTVPEPFGQVVVEGMAAGLPVVASGAGGPLEIIDDGRDGLLTTPGDVDALAAALRRLSEDGGLRSSLGDEARASSRRFGPEAAAQRLQEVYGQVAEVRLKRRR